jgi:hypothetical protein
MATTAILQVFDSYGAPKLQGSSSITDHPDWLELMSWAFGQGDARPIDGKIKDFNFTARIDAHLAGFIGDAVTRGFHFAKATALMYQITDTSRDWYLQFDMSVPTFTGFTPTRDTGTVAIVFEIVTITYRNAATVQSELGGNVPNGWSYDSSLSFG